MSHAWLDTALPLGERIEEVMNELTLEEKAGLLRHESRAVDRLDIPEYNWWNEALHGVARNGRATVFPQVIGLAAAFDRDLVHRVYTAISDEARAKYHAAVNRGNRGRYAGLTFWTPNINIFRDPRWGRGQETYGEDPYLTAELALACVRGLQGRDDTYLKSAACAKHFAVHSGPEKDRHTFDARPTRRDLHETYLPAFKRLVEEGGVEAVMGAYNRVDGEPACAQTYLMDQLRKQWGFKGHFVSDCWAIVDFHKHHQVTPGPVASVKRALEAGCDLNCGATYEHFLLKAVTSGELEERYLDQSLRRLLRTRFRLGMFDPNEQVPYASIPTSVIECDAHRDLALQAAQKSIVLLKNEEGVLPLADDTTRIFVCGHNAASIQALLGNYFGISSRMTTVLEGLTDRLPEGVSIEYKVGCLMEREAPNASGWAIGDAHSHDVVVAVVGLSEMLEGEEGDALLSEHVGDREQVELPANQVRFLQALFDTGVRVVVVIMAGSAIAMPEIMERAAAVVYAWYPGEEGGHAVADVLVGNYNPGGRLPVTFPRSTNDLPPFEDYNLLGRTYRFGQKDPLLRFGFGLSYSRFTYRGLRLTASQISRGESLAVSVTVTNDSEMPGDEVAQLYVTDLESSVPAPVVQLAGFSRIYLQPGESVEVTFDVLPDQLVVYDDHGHPFLEPGCFQVHVGGAQPTDAAFAGLSGEFELTP